MADNTVTTMPHKEGDTLYSDLEKGQWFWGFAPEGIPFLKVPGGCVSPVNGVLELDSGITNYFVGKKVWLCPPNTKITIITKPK